jgi:protein tyrosine/serine phosphatase
VHARFIGRFSLGAFALLSCTLLSQAGLDARSASSDKSSKTAATATASSSTAISSVRIGNFGQIDDTYFRGAQPKTGDYRDLAAIGVKTVIDLTRDGREDEAGLVKAAGMTFYRIPLTTSEAPSKAAVSQFLAIVHEQANLPVFVHCQGGRHRTGVMTAVYRMTQNGWSADQAYEEMKKFKFEGFPGHPELKSFVYDFFKALKLRAN